MMEKEDVAFLNQLIKTLEEARKKIEKCYYEKEYEEFNKLKKIFLKTQLKISEILE